MIYTLFLLFLDKTLQMSADHEQHFCMCFPSLSLSSGFLWGLKWFLSADKKNILCTTVTWEIVTRVGSVSLSYPVSLLQPENIPLFVQFVSLFALFF